MGMPLKRKEIGPQVFPTHNGKGPQLSPNTIPSLSHRDKISFGIKPKIAQSEENKPRIVMHIKHGKIAYNSAADKAAAAANKIDKGAVPGANKLHKLVPYDDNNSDSETEKDKNSSPTITANFNQHNSVKEERHSFNGNSAPKVSKQDTFEPVMDQKLNATTIVPGCYGPLNKEFCNDSSYKRDKDLKREEWGHTKYPSPVKRSGSLYSADRHEDSNHAPAFRRSLSDHSGLSVITSPEDRRVNATTRGWSVLDPEAQVSPSIASESSSITSVNSTTEWQVIDKDKALPPHLPEAQHFGWTVTPSKKNSPEYDKITDGLQITLKKTSPSSSKEGSPKDKEKGGDHMTNGANGDSYTSYKPKYYDQDHVLVRKSSTSLFGSCVQRNDPSSPYFMASKSVSTNRHDTQNGISAHSSTSSPAMNGISDSVSDESLHKKSKKHKKHKKKHKKNKHMDLYENEGDNDGHKKRKKHKKYKSGDKEPLLSNDTDTRQQPVKRRLSSEDECIKKKQKMPKDDYEWVERTIETISKKTDRPKQEGK